MLSRNCTGCPVKGAYAKGALPREAAGHEQGLQLSTKARMKRCKEQPILDKLSRASV